MPWVHRYWTLQCLLSSDGPHLALVPTPSWLNRSGSFCLKSEERKKGREKLQMSRNAKKAFQFKGCVSGVAFGSWVHGLLGHGHSAIRLSMTRNAPPCRSWQSYHTLRWSSDSRSDPALQSKYKVIFQCCTDCTQGKQAQDVMSKIAFSAPELGRDETWNCSSVEKASLKLRTHAARLRDGLKSNLTTYVLYWNYLCNSSCCFAELLQTLSLSRCS